MKTDSKLYLDKTGSGFYHKCGNRSLLSCRYQFINNYCQCRMCKFKFPIILIFGSINEHGYPDKCFRNCSDDTPLDQDQIDELIELDLDQMKG